MGCKKAGIIKHFSGFRTPQPQFTNWILKGEVGGVLAAVSGGGSFLSSAGDASRLERSIQISSEAKCELIARGSCLLCVS